LVGSLRIGVCLNSYETVAGLTRYDRPVLDGKRIHAVAAQPAYIFVSLWKKPKPFNLKFLDESSTKRLSII